MITIVLLSCSTSWCQTNHIPSTGEVTETDTMVYVPISAIKKANAKMIELKYEKEINENLRKIVSNDSIVINDLNKILEDNTKYIKKLRTQRNIFIGTTSVLSVILLIVLL